MSSVTSIRSIRDQITDHIREDLLCGRLNSGERLSEIKLAERFGVSRGPIRESLAQLTSEGLLVAKPNCGVTVAPEPPDDIRELIVPIRRTLETYALKLFFDDMTEQDFWMWDEILHGLERACVQGDRAAIAGQDIAFHRSIIARAGQADLLAVWTTILARIRGHFRQAVRQYGDDLIQIHVEHRELVDLLRGGNKKAAIKALERHIC